MSALDRIIDTDNDGVVPPIVCADGFKLSVQASWGHYAIDSAGKRPELKITRPHTFTSDAVLPWASVEVGYPSARPEPWADWEQYCDSPSDPTSTVYGYVPVDLVRALIDAHGGAA